MFAKSRPKRMHLFFLSIGTMLDDHLIEMPPDTRKRFSARKVIQKRQEAGRKYKNGRKALHFVSERLQKVPAGVWTSSVLKSFCEFFFDWRFLGNGLISRLEAYVYDAQDKVFPVLGAMKNFI